MCTGRTISGYLILKNSWGTFNTERLIKKIEIIFINSCRENIKIFKGCFQ